MAFIGRDIAQISKNTSENVQNAIQNIIGKKLKCL